MNLNGELAIMEDQMTSSDHGEFSTFNSSTAWNEVD